MSLHEELGFVKPFMHHAHETLLTIVVTGTLLVKEGQRILRPFGLTDAQFNILMLLKYQSGNNGMTQTTLGRMLLVNRSNVTGLIDRMEQAGLVRRTADLDDRRINMVEMTQAGSHILEEAQKAYYARIEEIIAILPEEERKRLCTLLDRVREQIPNSQKA